MSLFVASLNSGSNGNCYYIGNENEAVLIDAGLQCREMEHRMKQLGLDMKKVKAIFISHEHTDHIRGVDVTASRYQLPVYCTSLMWKTRKIRVAQVLRANFVSDELITVGALTIKPFRKYHDASDPHSFIVMGNGITIGVFTDLGRVCDNLKYHFSLCNAAFLESNYDVEMLRNGRYPYFLKTRITGGKGHLSNDEALDLFLSHRNSKLSHLFLSHLSADNNHPDIALQTFLPHANGCHISIASRFAASPVFEIKDCNATDQVIANPQFVQGTLFSS